MGSRPRALLKRRRIVGAEIRYIGKESIELEARETGLIHDPEQITMEYHRPQPISAEIVHWLHTITAESAARITGLSIRTIKAVRNGRHCINRVTRETLRNLLNAEAG